MGFSLRAFPILALALACVAFSGKTERGVCRPRQHAADDASIVSSCKGGMHVRP